MESAAQPRTADVAVVGGGVTGCAAAWFLAREGLRVVLLERGELASEASGAAAGMLAPIGESSGDDAFLRAGLSALARLPALCEELRERSGIDPEYEPSGILRVAASDRAARVLQDKRLALHAVGVPLEWLDARAARGLEPALGGELRGALWSEAESHVRSALLTRAFAGAAASLGAQILTGTPVVGIERRGERATAVRTAHGAIATAHIAVCTGAWCGSLDAWLGEAAPQLPVAPVRGQIVSLDNGEPPLRGIVWGDGAYLVPKRDGSVVVGATEERVGFDSRVTAEGVASLIAGACSLVPALGRAGWRGGWAGLRPGSPDGLPAIGSLAGVEGLTVAVGHHRNGVLLSPISGALIRDCVVGKQPTEFGRAFAPERWARTGGRSS